MLLALRHLRQQESWTRAEIESHQATALARLRAHAYAKSSFYREFHAGLTGRPLDELPVLTKSLLHDHFDEIVTDQCIDRATVATHAQGLVGDERFLGEYVVNGSSGTTGSSSYSLFNRKEWANVLASFSRFERHIGSFWGTLRRPRMAVIASATPWHISARVGATVRSSWLPVLRVDVGEPIDVIVQQLNAYQPQILATYASMTGILADEQTAGRLQIAPKRIVSAAEILSPALRKRVQAVWGDIVFDQYGASEGGTFAVECESRYRASQHPGGHTRGLHLFEDLYIFEVVDERNSPVPPGQCGDKVLLTVLFNHTLPLIRYELSDRVKMADLPCSCGCAFALIDEIQGRRERVLYFPGSDGGAVAVHPMVFYRILDAIPVTGWQVVQEGETLSLRLTGSPKGVDTQALVNSVRDALARLTALVPEIHVEWIPEMERGRTGKAAHIVPAL
jgi:phenylacetate-coenzyme A ligase PaaK-like adenylate-forming protein